MGLKEFQININNLAGGDYGAMYVGDVGGGDVGGGDAGGGKKSKKNQWRLAFVQVDIIWNTSVND